MDCAFVLTLLGLDELKEMGYREVWIGNVPNPHWDGHGHDGCVIASPKRKRGMWPAIWSAEKYFGAHSCANGLRKADQAFKEGARRMSPGHYILRSGKWERADVDVKHDGGVKI